MRHSGLPGIVETGLKLYSVQDSGQARMKGKVLFTGAFISPFLIHQVLMDRGEGAWY
jgi:hypothetical protein